MAIFWGKVGKGCDHCEVGVPIDYFQTSTGTISLCLECVLMWFPGRSVTWWESRHAPFRDHLQDRIDRAVAKQLAEGKGPRCLFA